MQVSKDNKSRGPTGESINRLLRTQAQGDDTSWHAARRRNARTQRNEIDYLIPILDNTKFDFKR